MYLVGGAPQLIRVPLTALLQRLYQTGEQLFTRLVQVVRQFLVIVQHLLHDGRHCRVQRHLRPWILRKPEVALDNVLQKTGRWLDELILDHVVEHGADGEKALCGHAEIGQAVVVHEDLLDDERRDRL